MKRWDAATLYIIYIVYYDSHAQYVEPLRIIYISNADPQSCEFTSPVAVESSSPHRPQNTFSCTLANSAQSLEGEP